MSGGALVTLADHPFSASMGTVLQEFIRNGTLARNHPTSITFGHKPFTSVVDKLFRVNCNWNGRFPSPPKGGWLNCASIFERIDDLARALVVCRYIDGPERVCKELIKAAAAVGLAADTQPKATEEGYYAHHIVLEYPLELLSRDGNVKAVKAKAEIQVTTQMQDALREMTHVHYKRRRVNPAPTRVAATRWDFKSPDFRAAYLGHTLHLIEGIVAELRALDDSNTPDDKGA